MGFGALFLGLMFLFDFEIARLIPGTQTAYAVLDMFPDAAGWILMFFGLRSLTKKEDGFEKYRLFPVFLFLLSLFVLAKGTVLFSAFYTEEGVQNFAGGAVDLSVHLLELGFLFCFFRFISAVCARHGEAKLERSFRFLPSLVVTEGVLFLLSKGLSLVSLPDSFAGYLGILGFLDYLFWITVIWWGAIALFRCLVKISD